MTTRLKALLTLAALTMLLALPSSAQAAGCPNEEFRTGPSASLPDCRAYELVTPEELGRTQAITFTVADHAIPSADGEHLALETYAPLEPEPTFKGTRAVFSRTARGWSMRSLAGPGAEQQELFEIFRKGVLNPNLSQVAFESSARLNYADNHTALHTVEVGPIGGPYALAAGIPGEYETYILGANAGTASVPTFTDVLFASTDHQLLPEGAERKLAESISPESYTGGFALYEWMNGTLRLVNIEGEGPNLKLVNNCGANLGDGLPQVPGANTLGAVSADGSKIFFTSPGEFSPCGPSRLYMRVDGKETVEVSAPQGVTLTSSERSEVHYDAASASGAEVVFNTSTPLLPGETTSEDKLFIYDTITHELKLIAEGVPPTIGTGGRVVLISEEGGGVYYGADENIYHYETQTGETSFVAAISTPHAANEPSYTTPNGKFLVFVSGHHGVEVTGPHGLEYEPRGVGHNELYRYDAVNGSVMCVSCGEGVAPAEGAMFESNGSLETEDETPPFIQMSENGQKVFFQTTAQLVPQDTNNPEVKEGSAGGFPGMDVYEWEADGAEEAPGIVCRIIDGCTHLISTGEDVGKSTFLGASENGNNIFFATAAQLVPQATPEFPNIYDARVDGGFALPREASPCLSCQGVGSTAPLFGAGASLTFTGPGNPVAPAGNANPKSKPKPKPKRRHKKTTKAKRATGYRKGVRRS